jgi:hypothetical protein
LEPGLTDLLCTRCGLCCDGTLVADVQLGPAEAARAELLGLAIDEDGERPVLAQPCAALEGRRCSVYAHRPRACRAFECALLLRARAGAVSVSGAIGRIEAARDLIGDVERHLGPGLKEGRSRPLRERCAEALASRPADRDLRRAIARLERLLARTFLGERAPARPRR